MVYGVEADPELAHLERIFGLVAHLEVLNALPVIILELRIVEGQEGGSLVSRELLVYQALCAVLAVIEVEADRTRPRVVRVLNDFFEYLPVGVALEDIFDQHR